jgi:hypothetical protein
MDLIRLQPTRLLMSQTLTRDAYPHMQIPFQRTLRHDQPRPPRSQAPTSLVPVSLESLDRGAIVLAPAPGIGITS